MESTRIHLIRHGTVADDWHGRVYGSLDAPLSPAGEAEARVAAERLLGHELDAVVSSGLARAEFGAACVRSERGLERRDESDLCEIDRGAWAGLWPEEIESRWPGAWREWWLEPETRRPESGESLGDLEGRVLPCFDRLAAEFPGGELAVVAHSWTLRVALTHALDLPLRAAVRLEFPPAAMATVDWPVGESGELVRPTMAGFGLERPPSRRGGWFRGPKRR